MNTEVWIVDDDRSVRFVLAEALRDAGYEVRDFDNARSALGVLAQAKPDVVFTDLRMPGPDGLALLAAVREHDAAIPVIVMSAYTDVASTAAAFRGGAFDYLPKPFDLERAVALAGRAAPRAGARREDAADEPAPSPVVGEPQLIGSSAAMRELFRAVGRVAPTRTTVLISGDTGTGKELVARALHRQSPRSGRAFVALNTAAIPAELLESELFGHEAGAFTGALRRHPGRFEQAEGGTLFLDEIGDMPLALQTRLLRVLSAGEYYRVGGRELLTSDVRLVAATHQDLEAKVAAGSFRADLLHRLDVIRLRLPALADRNEDIPLLARHFLDLAVGELGGEPKRFSPRTLEALRRRAWPGNVRQLENLCRRLAILAPGREILPADLPPEAATSAVRPDGDWTTALRAWAVHQLGDQAVEIHARARTELDRVLLDAALELTGGNRQQAAERLGLGRNTVTRKLGASRSRRPKAANSGE